MDSILKVVYDKWVTLGNDRHPLPNGIHPYAFNIMLKHLDIKQDLHRAIVETTNEVNTNFIEYDHSNFYGYSFRKLEFVEIDNVDTNSNHIYVYPLEVKGDLLTIIRPKQFTHKNDKIVYELKDTIDPKILSLMHSGKIKLLIHAAQDPYYYHGMDQLESYFNKIGINSTNIIFVPGNDNNEDYLEHYPKGKMKISAVPLMITQQCARMSLEFPVKTGLGYVSDLVNESDLDSGTIRPHRFICLNRTMKPHRYAMAYYALKNDLLKDNIFTFLNFFNFDAHGISNHLSNFDISNDERKQYSKVIRDILPYELDTHGLDESARGQITINNTKKDWYLSTYVSIVTETSFIDGRKPFISEKLWRPVMNLQPFILVGNYGTLKMIKDLGFKTFDSLIDETYDSVYDPKERMNLIFKEIDKLNKMPIKELHDWYYNIIDILTHNLETLRGLKDIDPYQVLYDDLKETYK